MHPRVLLFSLLLGLPATAAEQPTAAPSSPEREYVVFFGLDVFAPDRGQSRPVVGASEGEVLVLDEKNGTTKPVRAVGLAAEVSPKLSRTSVSIEGLDAYPVYSPATDPVAKAQEQLMTLQNIQADRQAASEARYRMLDANARALERAANAADPRDPGRGQMMADARAEAAKATMAAGDMEAAYATPDFRDFVPDGSGRRGDHDGYEIVFRLASTEPQGDAYGVVRLVGHDPQTPDVTVQALKAFRIRELIPKGRKIVIRIFGLPRGFHVESKHVHVYAGGRELASNLSTNRVELTEDEAHQYLVLQHAHTHRTATIPAQVLPELAPPAAATSLVAGRETLLVHLKISADGRVTGFDEKLAGASEFSPELQAALLELRFLPALVAGTPAASTGSFALGELFR